MAFTGNEGHDISLNDAVRFTAVYREEKGGEFLGAYFGKEAIKKILNQQECVGIRIYNAIDDSSKLTFVLVGVTADNNDMTGGELAEFSTGCPPNCPPDSPLIGSS
jgi:hypothetical protein